MAGLTLGDRVPDFDALWTCQPVLFFMESDRDRSLWQQFRLDYPTVDFIESVHGQLCELMGILDPKAKLSDPQRVSRTDAFLAEHGGVQAYGVWVYYPWLQKAIHILEEKDFITVRTNRNMYKITAEEQALFGTKKIGVIGMSVGKAIARVLTTERLCGEIRIADFDRLALSNLNRIQTSLVNIGMPKTTIVAREIAEQDPFIRVRVFQEGVTEKNMEDFLLEGGKLDVLIDECDSIDVKIQCRLAARAQRIPVIMETNDRGMLDVERFDLEPNRPLFHGLMDEEGLGDLSKLGTSGEKAPFVAKIIGLEDASVDLKSSMLGIDFLLESWPQLNSDVSSGSALVADEVRLIFLRHSVRSFRRRAKSSGINTFSIPKGIPWEPEAGNFTSNYKRDDFWSDYLLEGTMAPSGGNAQPWMFKIAGDTLELHGNCEGETFLDIERLGTRIALQACLENIHYSLHDDGHVAHIQYGFDFPQSSFYASITIISDAVEEASCTGCGSRHRKTDRGSLLNGTKDVGPHGEIVRDLIESLRDSNVSYAGREECDSLYDLLKYFEVKRITDGRARKELSREIVYRAEDDVGISIQKLNLRPEESLGVKLLLESNVLDRYLEIAKDETSSLGDLFSKYWSSCFCFVLVSADVLNSSESLKLVNTAWSRICALGYGVQPMSAGLFLAKRLGEDQGLEKVWHRITASKGVPLFILGVRFASKDNLRSLRKPVHQVIMTS